MDFVRFFEAATEARPYPWQERVAEDGLPEVADIETGAGKTAGMVLGWLYRLLRHPDPAVREQTPAWLVYALPMRSLVDQSESAIRTWLGRLELGEEVGLFRLLGGEGRLDSSWRERPGCPTIIVGTIDMILSRALMRGYAASRFVWPVEFGVLHMGCHYVFDEVQLLGPALPTGRQLDAFRRQLGVAAPCSSTWMSATLDPSRLSTVDNPEVSPPRVLTDADRQAGLAKRLSATRRVGALAVADPKGLGAAVLEHHRPGTLTLVVLNTVRRAQDVYAEVRKRLRVATSPAPEVHLLHSRFRPSDRAVIVERAIKADTAADGPGRVVVATQVVEAGIDVSATTLITDVAPWSSIVQRAGRCNRTGDDSDARLLWVVPPRPAPYDEDDLKAAAAALESLEGQEVTSTQLRELGKQVPEAEAIVPILRRRDLIELFDTSPDLVGNDLDVSRFIRGDTDRDIQVAWRAAVDDDEGRKIPFVGGSIRGEELCSVPIDAARRWLQAIRPRGVRAWTPDHLAADRPWRRVDVSALRPGTVVVVEPSAGGYDPERGWDGASKAPVPPVEISAPVDMVEVASVEETTTDDPATYCGQWLGLDDHLDDAERCARELLVEARVVDLTSDHTEAAVRAAALHDLGKVHEVFQKTILESAGPEKRDNVQRLQPLAKSAGSARARHGRAHFRHELVSALMLRAHQAEALAGYDGDLVRYLVAAHHGRVRLAIRPIPGEVPPADRAGARIALGVVDGEVVPAVAVRGMHLEPTVISLDEMAVGGDGSWTSRALALRDRPDLGPFRLAALEALVRIADWRASASPSPPAPTAAAEEEVAE